MAHHTLYFQGEEFKKQSHQSREEAIAFAQGLDKPLAVYDDESGAYWAGDDEKRAVSEIEARVTRPIAMGKIKPEPAKSGTSK